MPNPLKLAALLIFLPVGIALGHTSDSFKLLAQDSHTTLLDRVVKHDVSTKMTYSFGSPIVIYGWQGAELGDAGHGPQILWPAAGLVTGKEITDVVFDLSANKRGPTGSSYDPTGGPHDDYAEWIVDPKNSHLDELVPYAAVPEPTTILAALALLGAVAYGERRRLACLFARFSKDAPAAV